MKKLATPCIGLLERIDVFLKRIMMVIIFTEVSFGKMSNLIPEFDLEVGEDK